MEVLALVNGATKDLRFELSGDSEVEGKWQS
jgi:hypothetical protein